MSKVKIIAGDFKNGDAQYSVGSFSAMRSNEHWFWGESLSIKDFESIEVASEESVKKLGGTVGWGAVGALALGPIGLLAGLMLGGKGKDVTFIALHKDGRKFMATTDAKTYTKIQAGMF